MTVISKPEETTSDAEMVAVKREENEEAMDLCSRKSQTVLSAKMRLKKQRLDEEGREWPYVADGLHQLAEAAEIKQEESMELECSTSRVSPSLTITPVPIFKHSNVVLAPRSEYEVSSSGPSVHNESRQLLLGPNQNGKSFLMRQSASSPDSAIHSANFSPNQSPTMSRNVSGLSSPFSLQTSPTLSRNNSDASQYGGSTLTGPSSGMSEGSRISPRNSPLQARQKSFTPRNVFVLQNGSRQRHEEYGGSSPNDFLSETGSRDDQDEKSNLASQPGISRQQLINSPCPVCGDKISGFHYGIFSCESCKGFFKRTVQNKKNYVCLRGGLCPISIPTRKKCPACRFEKCIKMGMKLEAIREDRTRGGRSTYQCSYTLPSCVSSGSSSSPVPTTLLPLAGNEYDSMEASPTIDSGDNNVGISEDESDMITIVPPNVNVPSLLQEIMDVEHLWFSSHPHESSSHGDDDEPMVQTLAEMADKRLYKLVKWCKSLPLFKNILIDDQIALLINAWCELLVFSCCYRSVNSPGEIRVSNEKTLTAEIARSLGIYKWFDKMINFSDQMRRLKVDYYEYVSMKVIILLTSDASSLKEAEHVRDSQEKVVQALQQYTHLNSPGAPTKFAELLLRMPELHRVCQAGKELLCPRQTPENDSSGFNLLLELLRGDH